MIFKSLLPFLCLSVLCLCFFGCFEEADDLLDPVDPASEDQGQPEEVSGYSCRIGR